MTEGTREETDTAMGQKTKSDVSKDVPKNDDVSKDPDDCYELSLDDTTEEIEVQSVIDEAVAAIERHDHARQADERATDEPRDDGDGGGAATTAAEQGGALQERLLRTLADFDNYRKRTEREKAELRRHAAADVLRDMLGVVDNLERALAAGGNVEELKAGVEMILRQQLDLLRRHGVEPVAALERPFDPSVHEAVGREEREGLDVPTVTAELQRGYQLHDRLLRPAMVHVAMPASRPAAADDGDTQD